MASNSHCMFHMKRRRSKKDLLRAGDNVETGCVNDETNVLSNCRRNIEASEAQLYERTTKKDRFLMVPETGQVTEKMHDDCNFAKDPGFNRKVYSRPDGAGRVHMQRGKIINAPSKMKWRLRNSGCYACRGHIPSVQTDLKMTPNDELPNSVGVELLHVLGCRVCRVLGRRTTIANGRKVPSHRPSHYGTNGRMMT
mmetsp:Transcript_23390/g.51803  ORF Transcript_23390/g.51803 Transcript_23390/m.51803 type:complete len:196 (+) Transcript_23390:598-1185(+)